MRWVSPNFLFFNRWIMNFLNCIICIFARFTRVTILFYINIGCRIGTSVSMHNKRVTVLRMGNAIFYICILELRITRWNVQTITSKRKKINWTSSKAILTMPVVLSNNWSIYNTKLEKLSLSPEENEKYFLYTAYLDITSLIATIPPYLIVRVFFFA